MGDRGVHPAWSAVNVVALARIFSARASSSAEPLGTATATWMPLTSLTRYHSGKGSDVLPRTSRRCMTSRSRVSVPGQAIATIGTTPVKVE
ncbi:Uncharacterised protein [Mycobacteroides abscessus subsp. abscessus]|nr:Uncharacterised protein [Mycobacteroides abscessus subsp. abscessus]